MFQIVAWAVIAVEVLIVLGALCWPAGERGARHRRDADRRGHRGAAAAGRVNAE